MPLITEIIKIRFFKKVYLDRGGCHFWKGACFTNGYGQVRIHTKLYQTHRVAYLIEYGDRGARVALLGH